MAYETYVRNNKRSNLISKNDLLTIELNSFTNLVKCRLPSCTVISELLNSFSSLRMAALSLGVNRVHGLSALRS